MKPLQRARKAAEAFLAPIQHDFWEEHGIDEDEATLGIIAAFEHAGTFTEAEAKSARRALKREQKAEMVRYRRAAQERYDALTPEGKALEDSIRKMQDAMSKRMMDECLKTFGLPRAYGKILESPNAKAAPFTGMKP
jgi:hypothetical protein